MISAQGIREFTAKLRAMSREDLDQLLIKEREAGREEHHVLIEEEKHRRDEALAQDTDTQRIKARLEKDKK